MIGMVKIILPIIGAVLAIAVGASFYYVHEIDEVILLSGLMVIAALCTLVPIVVELVVWLKLPKCKRCNVRSKDLKDGLCSLCRTQDTRRGVRYGSTS